MTTAFDLRLAARAKGAKSSAIREILKVAARPDIVSFAGGLPAPELFPVEAMRQAAAACLSQGGAQALQYGPTDGDAGLRTAIAEQVSAADEQAARAADLAVPAPIRPEQVLITTGSQQALDLVSKLLLDPGDLMVTENPSYLGALQAFRLHEARFAVVDMDEHGATPESLRAALRQDPKLAYLLPTFQNPTGRSMSTDRRLAVAAVLGEAGVPVVEDDPYGALYYGQAPGPSLRSLQPELTISLGTFSKTLAPGLRLGWVVGPQGVIARLSQLKQSADLHTSTLSQQVALEVMRSGVMPAHLARLRSVYAERCAAMLTAVEQYFPDTARFTRPTGGMFVWVELPQGVDAARLLPLAIEEEKVAFVPGEPFHPNGGGENTLRLNFTHSRPDVILDAVGRLGRLMERSLERARVATLAASPV